MQDERKKTWLALKPKQTTLKRLSQNGGSLGGENPHFSAIPAPAKCHPGDGFWLEQPVESRLSPPTDQAIFCTMTGLSPMVLNKN